MCLVKSLQALVCSVTEEDEKKYSKKKKKKINKGKKVQQVQGKSQGI